METGIPGFKSNADVLNVFILQKIEKTYKKTVDKRKFIRYNMLRRFGCETMSGGMCS